jgi:L-serine dehydratase
MPSASAGVTPSAVVSVLDLFKIGIGPSSSHTVGPMIAAGKFVKALVADAGYQNAVRLTVELFGSLAWTGSAHGTETAIVLGLCGHEPATVDPDRIPAIVAQFAEMPCVNVGTAHTVEFIVARDLIFNRAELLPLHSNGMRFTAYVAPERVLISKIYYSIGGGFLASSDEQAHPAAAATPPLSFSTAAEALRLCDEYNISLAELQLRNELSVWLKRDLLSRLDEILGTMDACIDRGLRAHGELPGGLKVRRRAKALYASLVEERRHNRGAANTMEWVSAYAIAVNEENAAGGRVVTAPTNGAAGVIPAVLRYFCDFCHEYTTEGRREFLLTGALIGGIVKRNASISGAEAGCQGEVGSASAMAAAGLAAVLGGTPRQVENAAEIAIEHHLGMTCDPVAGLVQIPCIERNAFGAIKAIAAASLALRGDGTHRVTLDEAIATMRQTGLDMASKYKETSRGGLAVNVAQC